MSLRRCISGSTESVRTKLDNPHECSDIESYRADIWSERMGNIDTCTLMPLILNGESSPADYGYQVVRIIEQQF